ncbi:hypothetical protein F5Y18DRAFT_162602 [Xylariaceae sp. FL1019]|nr:hypothetical protein F5Y18DRAFT_162602 [Xylariaceae sp. FL1019]
MALVVPNMTSQDGVKFISGLLADDGVSSMLWGEFLLNIYGVPSIVGGMDFVVPDDKMPVAVATLKRSFLCPCPDPDACVVSGDSSPFPVPVFHMHVPGSELDVSLRAHSETLWTIPPPGTTRSKGRMAAEPSAYYIDASSPELPHGRPGRGHGAYSSRGASVLVPRAHVLLEAYIRLASAFREDYWSYFSSMITYMAEYVHADGLVDIDLLSTPCRTFWYDRKQARFPTVQLANTLQRDLDDEVTDTSDPI